MKLYAFPTSSASYRVRIALHLKGIAFETATVDLPGKQQRRPEFRDVNPQHRVPALELDDGTILTQSLAIIGYLEQTHPTPALYPADPVARARALAVALAISSEIQPVNNTSVTDYVRANHGMDDAGLSRWQSHFMRAGLVAVEQLIDAPNYAFGNEPTIADICIVPQVFNAHRFKVDISDLPKVSAVADIANANPAFAAAHPNRQPGVA